MLIALLLVQAAASLESAAADYRTCVLATARKWSGGADSAETIAVGARSHCGDRERRMRDMALASADPSLTAQQLVQWRRGVEQLNDAYVEGVRRKAVAAVLEARAR
ncbi:hypothetical protein [Sphingobium indicum]